MFIQGIDYIQWHSAKQGSWNSHRYLMFHKETNKDFNESKRSEKKFKLEE